MKPLVSLLLAAWAGVGMAAPLPLYRDHPFPVDAPAQDMVITGVNHAPQPVTLVLRLDAADSVNYRSRVNEERLLPPGPFSLRLPAGSLKRSNGRPFDLRGTQRLFLFTEPAGAVEADIVLVPAPPPFAGGIALDAGPADQAPALGFERLAPDDPRLAGMRLVAVRRTGSERLLADGIVGIDRLTLPVPPGRWHLKLWLEDPGEWETLPRVLVRTVWVNGEIADQRNVPLEDWISRRYLAAGGRDSPSLTLASEAFLARRGDVVEAFVTTAGEPVTVSFEAPAPVYLAGLALVPATAEGQAALAQLDQRRAEGFDADWPVWSQAAPAAVWPDPQLARGESRRLRLTLPPVSIPLAIEPPAAAEVQAWEARWTLDRAQAASQLLIPTTQNLLPLGTLEARHGGLPREITLWLTAKADAAPGRYSLRLHLADQTIQHLPFDILPGQLAAAEPRVGLYLDDAPLQVWRAEAGEDHRDAQYRCDAEFLRRLGLITLAPPLDLRTPERVARLLAASAPPWLAYAGLKRTLAAEGIDGGLSRLKGLDSYIAEGLQREIFWSVADEPSNPQHGIDDLAAAETLRATYPNLRLAAHLNAPADRVFLPKLDMALVNQGFGLDRTTLRMTRAALARPKAHLWIYNADHPRLAAGIWRWLTGADGYLQWHGQMPTADPFDPTDGREADFTLLLPRQTACPVLPGIDARLLDLAEAVQDSRWVATLAATDTPAARRLLAHIRDHMGDRWNAARTTATPQFFERFRDQARRSLQP